MKKKKKKVENKKNENEYKIKWWLVEKLEEAKGEKDMQGSVFLNCHNCSV